MRVCCAGPAQTRQQPKANAQGQRDVQQRECPAIRNQPAAQMQERNPTFANPSRRRDATKAHFRGSIVIGSSACHAEDPESTPGRGASTHIGNSSCRPRPTTAPANDTTPTNARGSRAQLVTQRREREPNRDRRAEASARRERQTTNTRTSNKNRQCKKRQLDGFRVHLLNRSDKTQFQASSPARPCPSPCVCQPYKALRARPGAA